jgi:hypothetical protein
VQQAQHAVAVLDGRVEEVAAQLQIGGDGLQHPHAQAVERAVHPADIVVEAGNLGRPDIVGHVGAERVAWRQVAADVPEFLQVVMGGALGGLDPERDVAARAALDRVEQEVLREHLQSCVTHAFHNGSLK